MLKLLLPLVYSVLNVQLAILFEFFQPHHEENSYSEIILPPSLMDSPENTPLSIISVTP